jgi:outer membrane protein
VSTAPVGTFRPATSSTQAIVLERVTVDDAGNRLLVVLNTSRQVECFVFERREPPSLFIQFLSSQVVSGAAPIQVVGVDPLSEIRYGYTTFQGAAVGGGDRETLNQLDYIELKLTRPVFYHVQQEGWVLVVGLDRTTAKVEVPELDFRFDSAQYQGAANLPDNPNVDSFVQVSLANSRLLTVAREESDLAKTRVFEAQRALFPSLTARVTSVRGKEVNPFPDDRFEGFESAAFRRDEYGFQLSQPIYESGRLMSAFRQSKINRQMALENLRKQAQDLTFEVKKAYFTLLKNQSILQARRHLVAQGEVIRDMVRQKQKLNLTSRAEVLNVNAQADQASYQLISDEQDVLLSRLVLISLMNQSNSAPDPLPGELGFSRMSFNVESIISWAQEHRPDVRIAKLNAELARQNWIATRADNNVKVAASGFVGRAAASFDEDPHEMQSAWNVGVRMSRSFWGNEMRASYAKENTAPDLGQSFIVESEQKSVEIGILDRIPARSNARQAQLTFERAKAELVEASRKAEYEVRETYYNLEKASRQLEAVRQDLIFRRKDLDITREKVKLGLAELSQHITAEVAHTQAMITEQDALSAYNIALAAMDKVAGAEVVRN